MRLDVASPVLDLAPPPLGREHQQARRRRLAITRSSDIARGPVPWDGSRLCRESGGEGGGAPSPSPPHLASAGTSSNCSSSGKVLVRVRGTMAGMTRICSNHLLGTTLEQAKGPNYYYSLIILFKWKGVKFVSYDKFLKSSSSIFWKQKYDQCKLFFVRASPTVPYILFPKFDICQLPK